MPDYHVTDPSTGKSITLTGDSPPTEQELEQIFSRLNDGSLITRTGIPPSEHGYSDIPPKNAPDEPGSFAGGFLKSIQDQILNATARNPKFQDMAAPVSNLGGVVSYLLPTPTMLPGVMQRTGGAMQAAGDAMGGNTLGRRSILGNALEYSILRPLLGDKAAGAVTATPYVLSGGGRALSSTGRFIDPSLTVPHYGVGELVTPPWTEGEILGVPATRAPQPTPVPGGASSEPIIVGPNRGQIGIPSQTVIQTGPSSQADRLGLPAPADPYPDWEAIRHEAPIEMGPNRGQLGLPERSDAPFQQGPSSLEPQQGLPPGVTPRALGPATSIQLGPGSRAFEMPASDMPPIRLAPGAAEAVGGTSEAVSPMEAAAQALQQQGSPVVVTPGQPLGMPRVLKWNQPPEQALSPADALKARIQSGSREGAAALNIPQSLMKAKTPGFVADTIPLDDQFRIRATMAGMSPDEATAYLAQARNPLARAFIEAELAKLQPQ